MQNNQLLCDLDGEVVSGREKMAEIKKTHIQIEGKIIYSEFSEEFNKRLYFDITKFNRTALIFCDVECLETYVEQQVDKVRPKIIEAIRTPRKSQYIDWDKEPQYNN